MSQGPTFTRAASFLHRWIALLVVVPILFWFASGLFFALAPIERVRSEHMIADQAAVPVPIETAALGLARISPAVPAADRIEIKALLGRPVAVVASGALPPRLYDLGTGRLISPILPATAAEIAARDLVGGERPQRVVRVTANSPEYRGPLPAWRADFEGANRSVYVAAHTGAVASRRSTLWRVFDFLWAMHILDFEEHENINNPLLIAASALGLLVVLTGIALLPNRLGLTARLGRRRERTAGRDQAAISNSSRSG